MLLSVKFVLTETFFSSYVVQVRHHIVPHNIGQHPISTSTSEQLGNFYPCSSWYGRWTDERYYPNYLPDYVRFHGDHQPRLEGDRSTTSRSQFDLTTQADHCDRLQGHTWSYVNCEMDAVRQLYRVIVYRALVADMHGMYYMSFFPVHLMCTARTFTSSSSVHSSVVVRDTFCYFVVNKAQRLKFMLFRAFLWRPCTALTFELVVPPCICWRARHVL